MCKEMEKKATSPEKQKQHSDVHLSLAQQAVIQNRVRCVGNGAWVVIEPDGVTHRATRVLNRETCSCHATTTCYHINACKMMIGLPLSDSGKINVFEMHRKKVQGN